MPTPRPSRHWTERAIVELIHKRTRGNSGFTRSTSSTTVKRYEFPQTKNVEDDDA